MLLSVLCVKVFLSSLWCPSCNDDRGGNNGDTYEKSCQGHILRFWSGRVYGGVERGGELRLLCGYRRAGRAWRRLRMFDSKPDPLPSDCSASVEDGRKKRTRGFLIEAEAHERHGLDHPESVSQAPLQ